MDIESQTRQLQQHLAPSTVSAIFVHIDKYKMEQVVRNFMTNALKFTPSGGAIDVRVSLQAYYSSPVQQRAQKRGASVRTSDVIVRVEVKDSGAGISKVVVLAFRG
jgi:signal transduction histidine kinase